MWIMREDPLLNSQLQQGLLPEEQDDFDVWPVRLAVRTKQGEWTDTPGPNPLRESIASH